MAKNTNWMRGTLYNQHHVRAGERDYPLGSTKKYLEPAEALKKFFRDPGMPKYLTKPVENVFPSTPSNIVGYYNKYLNSIFTEADLSKPVFEGVPYSVMDFITKPVDELLRYFDSYKDPAWTYVPERVKAGLIAFQRDPGKVFRAYDTRFTNLTVVNPTNPTLSFETAGESGESNMGRSRAVSKVIFRPQDCEPEFDQSREAWEITLIPGLLPPGLDLGLDIEGFNIYWVSFNTKNTVAFISSENKKRNDSYTGPHRIIFDEDPTVDSTLRDLIDQIGMPSQCEYSIHVDNGIRQPGDILPEFKAEPKAPVASITPAVAA